MRWSLFSELPKEAKAVITTRKQVQINKLRIHLDSLPKEDSLELIQQQAQEKEIKISQEDALKVYKHFGGVPIALIYVIGQLASGFSLKTILNSPEWVPDDIVRFCFDDSVKPLRGQAAHKLLICLAIFNNPSVSKAVA